jgi:hypothetical protein
MLGVLAVAGAVSLSVTTPTFADTGPYAPFAWGGVYQHRFWRGYYW